MSLNELLVPTGRVVPRLLNQRSDLELFPKYLRAITPGDQTHFSYSYFAEAVRLANKSIGETISIAKPVIMKKPFILPKQALTGATITISKDKPGQSVKSVRKFVFVVD